MSSFLAKRALHLVATLVAVSLAMFLLLYIGPNPLHQLQETSNLSAADVAALTEEYGWNEPWYKQYGHWATGVVQGDWGESLRTRQPAGDMIVERLPVTAALSVFALMIAALLSIPIAIVAAVRQGTRVDYAITAASLVVIALPGFFLALLLQGTSLQLKDVTGHLPLATGGPPEDVGVVEWVRHMLLPIATLALVQIAIWTRFQRGELIHALGADFVSAARAKGIDGRAVMLRHVVRSTLPTLVTLIAVDAAHLLGGSMVVEAIYGLPGLGTLLLQSVEARDVVVVLDIVAIGAIAMVLLTSAADALNGWLDPRTRREVR